MVLQLSGKNCKLILRKEIILFSSYDMNAASWLVNICAHN